MLYVRFPLSLRNVEDLLHERGVDVSYESVRYWWHRFGAQFASQIKKRRAGEMQSSNWKWHLDEVFVKINGERHYLWRAVDHEGEVLEKTTDILVRAAKTRAVVVVEHDMEFVRRLNCRVTVLHEGSVLAEGTLAHVTSNPEVIEVYLGR